MDKETKNHQLERGFFVNHRTVSAVKTDFVSDRVSHIVPRGCWCNIIVLNVHALSKEESDDVKESFMRNQSRFFIIFRSTI
jgi:hypothetical protein